GTSSYGNSAFPLADVPTSRPPIGWVGGERSRIAEWQRSPEVRRMRPWQTWGGAYVARPGRTSGLRPVTGGSFSSAGDLHWGKLGIAHKHNNSFVSSGKR